MPNVTKFSESGPAKVGLLAYPGVQLSALHGLSDLFEVASRMGRAAGHAGVLVERFEADETGPVASGAGRRNERRLDAFVIPPSLAKGTPRGDPATLDWIRRRHQAGAVACSVCAGAFLLGQSGLLDGRRATTHWGLEQDFAHSFPAVRLEIETLLVDDGDIMTAGGVMAWTDLGLRLIQRFVTPSVMLDVARHFLIDPPGREQRYYSSFTPRLNHGDAAVLKAQHWLQEHYSKPVTVPEMAEQAGLTGRTFLRRFQKSTGHNPVAYVQQLRIMRARELLEFSVLAFNRIAWQVGYEDPAAFRRVFQRALGLTPGNYRDRFGVNRAGQQTFNNAERHGSI